MKVRMKRTAVLGSSLAIAGVVAAGLAAGATAHAAPSPGKQGVAGATAHAALSPGKQGVAGATAHAALSPGKQGVAGAERKIYRAGDKITLEDGTTVTVPEGVEVSYSPNERDIMINYTPVQQGGK